MQCLRPLAANAFEPLIGVTALFTLSWSFYCIYYWWRGFISFFHVLVIFEQRIYHLLGIFIVNNRTFLCEIIILFWIRCDVFRLNLIINSHLQLLMPWNKNLWWYSAHSLNWLVHFSLILGWPLTEILLLLTITVFICLFNIAYTDHWCLFGRTWSRTDVNSLSPLSNREIWAFLMINLAVFSIFNLFRICHLRWIFDALRILSILDSLIFEVAAFLH